MISLRTPTCNKKTGSLELECNYRLLHGEHDGFVQRTLHRLSDFGFRVYSSESTPRSLLPGVYSSGGVLISYYREPTRS